ncbi:hypothetical protein GCM10020216_045760 [Nonomuraea helvata]
MRELFEGPRIIRAIGAHDALGARLGERTGFDAIWSSGLEISASHGVPDADILTMGELLNAARWIADAVRIPVIADCDTGYGNASNVVYMTRRYEAAGIAAVCIEDKPFPKLNSFIPGRQRLVPISEFTGKIRAATDARSDPDFMVIARVEAMVAGLGLEEATRRAHAYADAGADAVLVHAKGASPQPALDFLAAWDRPTPVVVVPTTYYRVSAAELEAAGASMVIYANHGLRAGVRAVTDAFSEIRRTGSTESIEDKIAPLSTIFDLQGVSHLRQHEDSYMRTGGDVHAVVAVIDGLTPAPPSHDRRALAESQVRNLRLGGAQQVSLVLGPGAGLATEAEARVLAWDETWSTELDAVLRACSDDDQVVLVAAADTLYDPELVRRLAAHPGDIVLAVHTPRPGESGLDPALLPVAFGPPEQDGFDMTSAERVVALGSPAAESGSAFIGLVRFTRKGLDVLRDVHARMPFARTMADALAAAAAEGNHVSGMEFTCGWSRLSASGAPTLATR